MTESRDSKLPIRCVYEKRIIRANGDVVVKRGEALVIVEDKATAQSDGDLGSSDGRGGAVPREQEHGG